MDISISVMSILMLAIASENATTLFLKGSIFNRIRDYLAKVDFFAEMFSCFLCTSFWVSVFMGLMALYCPFAKYILGLMLIHAGARYINTIYIYVLTGSKSTVPFTKPVKFED